MAKKTKGSPTKDDIQIGLNLKTIRRFRGMAQADLGEKIGITFQQIQKYEKGTNRIAGGRFIDLSNALDVPVSAFFEGAANYNKHLEIPKMTKRQSDILNILMHIDNPDIEKSFLAILKNHHINL